MKLLEDRILRDGQVRPGNVLKVDCFLNHQLDVDLLDKIGEEFYRIFKDDGVNKILTIEASGIAIACMTARHFDVPVVFAKKAKSKNIDGDVYTSTVHSYTYGKDYNITLAQKFLGPNDRVLILDDFLANPARPCAVCWMSASRPEPVWRVSASALKKASSRAATSCAARVTNWPAWPLWTKWAITAA